MTAYATVDESYDLAYIAAQAGQSNSDYIRYYEGVLYVDYVTQADLDTAIAAYDPTAHALSDAQDAQKVLASTWCENHILSDITSSALGADYTYPMDRDSQMNVSCQCLYAHLYGATQEPYKAWCADSGGAWDYRDHTSAEIQTLHLAMRAHVIQCQAIYDTIIEQIDACTTVEEVEVIGWNGHSPVISGGVTFSGTAGKGIAYTGVGGFTFAGDATFSTYEA